MDMLDLRLSKVALGGFWFSISYTFCFDCTGVSPYRSSDVSVIDRAIFLGLETSETDDAGAIGGLWPAFASPDSRGLTVLGVQLV
jgi:hypothetical protein